MELTIARDRDATARSDAGRRPGAPAALAALVAIAALAIALLSAAPAEAKPTRHLRDSRSVETGAGSGLADKHRARQRRGVARHHAVDQKRGQRDKRGHRGKPKRGAKSLPVAPTAGPADPSPVTDPGAPLSPILGPPAPPSQADGRASSPQGGAAQPPVQHGVEPDPDPQSPPAEEPKPPAEEPKPPAEEPKPPAEEPKPPAEEPKPPAEEPKPPVEEPKPPAEEPKPPAEEPKPPAEEPESPPSSGALLFEGRAIRDFDLMQAAKGAITEVPDPLGSGQTVLRMTVDDGDVAPVTPTDNPRAQLLSPDLIERGDEIWLKTKFLLPQDFPTVNGWLSLVEIHGPPFSGSSPWQVEVIGDSLQWTRNRTYGYDVPWQTTLPKGRWVTLLLHERFATDGFVEMWIDGQPVSFFGRETRLAMQTMDSTNDGGANSAKIMNYRKAGMFETATVYFGPLLVGASRAAVEP